MKIMIALLTLVSTTAIARDVYVQPHIRNDGTVVQGYHRTSPDSNPFNNYGTQGNTNPYTAQTGTINPYSNPYAPQKTCHRDVYGNTACN